MMVFAARAPRVSRKGVVPALVGALVVVFSLFSVAVPTARATEAPGEGSPRTPAFETSLLDPHMDPHPFPPNEHVWGDLTTAERNEKLNNCRSGRVCLAVGQGDGNHTVFELYYCGERSLTDFMGAGAITNNQSGGAAVRLENKDGVVVSTIPANNTPTRIYWDPVWYLTPC
jgi:hypothetical protein